MNSEELRDEVFQINSLSIRQSISQAFYLLMVLLCLNKSILTRGHSHPQKFRQIVLKIKFSQYLGHSDLTSLGFTLLPFVGGRGSFKILLLPGCKIFLECIIIKKTLKDMRISLALGREVVSDSRQSVAISLGQSKFPLFL